MPVISKPFCGSLRCPRVEGPYSIRECVVVWLCSDLLLTHANNFVGVMTFSWRVWLLANVWGTRGSRASTLWLLPRVCCSNDLPNPTAASHVRCGYISGSVFQCCVLLGDHCLISSGEPSLYTMRVCQHLVVSTSVRIRMHNAVEVVLTIPA